MYDACISQGNPDCSLATVSMTTWARGYPTMLLFVHLINIMDGGINAYNICIPSNAIIINYWSILYSYGFVCWLIVVYTLASVDVVLMIMYRGSRKGQGEWVMLTQADSMLDGASEEEEG